MTANNKSNPVAKFSLLLQFKIWIYCKKEKADKTPYRALYSLAFLSRAAGRSSANVLGASTGGR